jgi:hypothetical protein
MSDLEVHIVEEDGPVDQSEKPITVTSRPRGSRPSASYLPPELIHYFNSKNYRIGLRARNDAMKGQDQAMGWRDVRFSEQPERIQEMMRELFEIDNDLVYRSDWIVRERTFASEDEQREWEDEIKANLESDDYFIRELDGKIGELSRDGGGAGEGVVFGDKRSVRADVISGPDAVRAGLTPDDVLKAIEERKKEGK